MIIINAMNTNSLLRPSVIPFSHKHTHSVYSQLTATLPHHCTYIQYYTYYAFNKHGTQADRPHTQSYTHTSLSGNIQILLSQLSLGDTTQSVPPHCLPLSPHAISHSVSFTSSPFPVHHPAPFLASLYISFF